MAVGELEEAESADHINRWHVRGDLRSQVLDYEGICYLPDYRDIS